MRDGTSIIITTGNNVGIREPYLIDIFSRINSLFKTNKIRTQIISSAFSKKQLERIKQETGNISYTSNLEVSSKGLFEWICPGKAKAVGFDEWRRRLYDTVEVLGN